MRSDTIANSTDSLSSTAIYPTQPVIEGIAFIQFIFITEGNEVKLSVAEEQQAGSLNLNLKWERWAVDDNGYGFTL